MQFLSKEKLEEALDLLEVFAVDDDSLPTAVYDFFQVYREVRRLEGAPSSEVKLKSHQLLKTCDDIETVIVAHRAKQEKQQGNPIHIIPESKVVPMQCFLAETLSQVSLLKLQVRALQSGKHLRSTASQILNLSKLEDLTDSGIAARENICRWLM